MAVHLQENLLQDGLTEHEFMSVYHDGELAAVDGLSVLESPYLDDAKLLPIWMMGYMEVPIPTTGR